MDYQDSNVTVMVTDFDRAVKFYTEALGLSLKFRAGNEWAEVTAPGLTIGLHTAREPGPRSGPPGSVSIGLQIENLEAAVAQLKERGVHFPAPINEDGFVRIAFFGDPDGTPLYLCQVRASHQGSATSPR